MNEIDWSQAPEGATHYNHTCFDWYKVGSHEPSFWNGREWVPARFWDDRKHDCIQRPTTPSWSGEGLPPVGTVLQVAPQFKSEAGTVEVVGNHEAKIICVRLDGDEIGSYRSFLANELVTIRTIEQVAADGREEAINALATVIGTCKINSVEMATTIYDEGYRKL